jgi:uncharacterized membrane protein YfcA
MTPGVDLGSAWSLAALVLAGGVAGFVNTLAGGGSLLTLPALMLLGLPPDVANGTNRVAILAQNVASAHAFDDSGRLDRRAVASVVGPTLIGALVGALTASYLPRELLKPLLIGTLVLVATTLVRRPRALASDAPTAESDPRRVGRREAVMLLGVGLYGGFVQAGVGFFLLAVLGSALRYDLVRANALKVVAVGAFTAVALVVFVARGQVSWVAGGVLAVGTVAGARLGVRFALRSSERALRLVVFVAVLVVCAVALLR